LSNNKLFIFADVAHGSLLEGENVPITFEGIYK